MPYSTDEHGAVVRDPSTPQWVVTEAQHERWAECVRIAKLVTGQQENTVEVDNFAASVYAMPNPTHPPRPDAGQLAEAALSPRTRRLLAKAAGRRRRDRLGRWADGPVASDGGVRMQPVALAPRSPGARRPRTSRDEIRALGLDKWPDPTPKALGAMGGKKTTAARFYATRSPGTEDDIAGEVHPPYAEERQAVHDRAVGVQLAGLPTAPGEAPTGLAELLGTQHPIVQKLAQGDRLSDDEKEQVRVAADAARDGGPPQALFTAGGPASGKTTVLRDNRESLRPLNAVTVDADEIKDRIPEYGQLRMSGDDATRRYAASAVHLESGDIAARVAAEARELGLNVVMDGTGDGDPGEYVRELERKRDAGYDVSVLYVNAPTDQAIVDAVMRAEEKGRFVPIPRVQELHAKVSQVFDDEVSKLDWLKVVNVFERSEHIATGGAGFPQDKDGRHVLAFDRPRFKSFIAKRHEEWEREGRRVQESDEQGHLIDEQDELPTGVRPAEGDDERVPPEQWIIEDPHDVMSYRQERVPRYLPRYEPEDPGEGDGDPS